MTARVRETIKATMKVREGLGKMDRLRISWNGQNDDHPDGFWESHIHRFQYIIGVKKPIITRVISLMENALFQRARKKRRNIKVM
jgi:hypothetical protein